MSKGDRNQIDKVEVLAILQSRPYGSTLPQFLHDVQELKGFEYQLDKSKYETIEQQFVEQYSDIMRFEKRYNGETLYYAVAPKENYLPQHFEIKKVYDVKEQIHFLNADSRGWYTVFFRIPYDVIDPKIFCERFAEFGHVADFHMNVGKVFVRYMSLEAATKALERYGTDLKIYSAKKSAKSIYKQKVEESNEEIECWTKAITRRSLTKSRRSNSVEINPNRVDESETPPPLVVIESKLSN